RIGTPLLTRQIGVSLESAITFWAFNMVYLTLSSAQSLGTTLTLTVSGVEDLAGNAMTGQDLGCTYIESPAAPNSANISTSGGVVSGSAGSGLSGTWVWEDYNSDGIQDVDEFVSTHQVFAVFAGTELNQETIVAQAELENDGSFGEMVEFTMYGENTTYTFPSGSYDLYIMGFEPFALSNPTTIVIP
ncbi:MAG: hypothetical protein P1P77_17200, partial [Spirochaetaceae bacterium]|nr:hypothetical protein [Spirochaetaceae bacterium]